MITNLPLLSVRALRNLWSCTDSAAFEDLSSKGTTPRSYLLPLKSIFASVSLMIMTSFEVHAQIHQINVLPAVTIHQASNSQAGSPPSWYATRPHAYGYNVDNGGTIVRKIFLSWLVNPDYYPGTSTPYPHLAARRLSLDGGKTWAAATDQTVTNAAAMSVIRRRNGEMLALSFRPAEGYFKSTNNGTTWTKYTDGSVRDKQFNGVPMATLFHRNNILEENNGDLYAMGYVANVANNIGSAYLFRSTDGGKDWFWVSTPAHGGAAPGDGRIYNEPTLERCADGSWLVVVRDERLNSTSEMRARRTNNQGVTWTLSGPTLLPGLPTRPNTSYKRDCDPMLKLMPNGVLVLAYGPNLDNVPSIGGASRDCVIAFSNDGIGASWTSGVTVLDGKAYGPNPIGLESSGYTDVVPVSAHRFLMVGDTGHTWSYTDDVMVSPNPYKIWGRHIDIVRAPYNRIDLRAMLAQNPGMVTTDLTYTNSVNPEARVSGAVDGSNDYWSGAFKSGAAGVSGTYTIDLLRNYTINHVGVCMQYNTAQSATIAVATSLAGPWTNVATHTNVVQNALKYTAVTPIPITARYVRATVTAAAGQTKVCLNEIEVYSTAHSFENCGQNIAPYGFNAPPNGGFYVTEGVAPPSGYQSTRALYLSDTDSSTTTGNKTISLTVLAGTSKTVEFMLKPIAYATSPSATSGAIQWQLLSGSTIGFRLRAAPPSGQIQWYNGSTYTSIAGAVAPTNTWTRIKVVASATTDTASLYVNDVLKGALNSIQDENNVSSIDKLQFTSGGGAAVGDKALFDDVSMN